MTSDISKTGLNLRAGQRVGLLGGSFDPPHAGHVNITKEALRRFDLDKVVWLVSPGNPLKPHGPAPLGARMAAARVMVKDPRVIISDAEARIGTRYTAETIAVLQKVHPGVRFVWLMGADNLAQFHRWERWQEIMAALPVGVLARPGDRISARMSRTARVFRAAQLPPRAAGLLPLAKPPAWCFVNVPMLDLSSSAIRARGGWSG
ncbi:nicotinate-nucleotide adenylyltransferase [Puniceibacterium sediminis]|uniref:Probable nicotinate-nucleotide adenylyltransferase n=1 Tax=Puniceibacterium sediminis TaxID=1608407 RepID=A0A238ZDN1_9RHOB|nr:nicotinate-nucleotide adenylyltransferase [Puniceibacterium sediminis]SNR81626.1 nicotinate-nucleotide adenylyltransferase [Puniceibacterium sediminis]